MKKYFWALSLIKATALIMYSYIGGTADAAGAVTATNAEVKISNDLFDFPNGDFECGEMYGWTLYSSDGSSSTLSDMIDTNNTKVVSNEKHSGNYAFQAVRKDTGSNYLEFRAELRNPVPGTVYNFTYYGKTTGSAKFHSDIYLRYLNSSGDPVTLYHIANTSDEDYITATDNWEERTYSFNVLSSYGDYGDLSQYDTLYVDFRLVEYGAGTIYIDDVSVEESEVPTYGSNKIDTDFSNAGWKAAGAAVTNAEEKKSEYQVYCQDFTAGLGYFTGNGKAFSLGTDPDNSSNQVLRYTGKNAWDYEGQYSGSLFTTGEEYTMSFRYYAKSMTGANSPIVVQCGFSGSLVNILTINRAKDDTGWIDVSYTFTAGVITNSTRLFQVVNGGDGTCEVYFDDIKITHTKIYDTPVYSAGRYQDKNSVWVLHTDAGGEFYRDSLVMTPGHTYQISFDVKTESSYLTPYFMDRTNGNVRTDLNQYKVAENTDWTEVNFEYYCDGTDKSTNSNGDIVYRLGFFRNSSGGSVYVKNLILREIIYPDSTDKETTLKDASVISADSSMAENAKIFSGKITFNASPGIPAGVTYEGGSVSATVLNVTAGKKYKLTYKVLTSYGDGNFEISGSFGDISWSVADFGQEDGWLTVEAVFTAQSSGDITLTLINGNYAFYRDICLNRVYEYGDMNGDDFVNIRDLVAYKKYLADTSGFKPKTLVYSDMDKNDTIDAGDMTSLRKVLLGIS